jgi:hypothetical protein
VAAGRCAGCGETGSSCKIAGHILTCPDWQALYAADRSRALSPEAEYRRWQDGGRTADRAERLLAVTSDVEGRRTAAALRFRPPDILDD